MMSVSSSNAVKKMLAAGVLLSTLFVSAAIHPQTASAATVISSIDTSLSTYDKLTMTVDGKPFLYRGIDVRADRLTKSMGWTDAEVENVIAQVAADKFTAINIPLMWIDIEPTKDTFNWTVIDKYIGWCEANNIKLEILWFGHDGTGASSSSRIPGYVLSDYQHVIEADGTVESLMDKTDPNLLAREEYVLGKLMDHLASYNTAHGDKKTVIGIQLENEPRVTKAGYDDRSYSSYSTDLWNAGGYASMPNGLKNFKNKVLLDYQNGVAGVVKSSDYSIYTRGNIPLKYDAAPIAENETKRSNGGTNMDFYGFDPYVKTTSYVYAYGTDPFWAKGKNFPMIMENYANLTNNDYMNLSTLAGNAVISIYQAVKTDSFYGLYDIVSGTHQIQTNAISQKVAEVNELLGKAWYDIASKRTAKANGTKINFYNNEVSVSASVYGNVNGVNVNYSTSDTGTGIAISRSSSEYALLSYRTGTFTIPKTIGTLTAASIGYYDSNNAWVNQGTKTFTDSGTDFVVNMNAGECVRLTVEPPSTAFAPTADAMVRSGSYADQNFGTTTTLSAKQTPSYPDNNRISYLQFDFSGFSKPIGSAKLQLYKVSGGASGDTVHFYGINNDAWTESGITWNTAPDLNHSSYGITGTDITDLGTLSPTAEGWITVDLTGFAASQSDHVVTIVAVEDTPNNYKGNAFTSREGTSNQPQLLLEPQ